VAEDERPPGTDIVDVAIAVGVPDVRAQAANQERRVAADRAEGANGRVDAAGDKLLGTFCRARDLSRVRDMVAVPSSAFALRLIPMNKGVYQGDNVSAYNPLWAASNLQPGRPSAI
jgi:hypothetical protein